MSTTYSLGYRSPAQLRTSFTDMKSLSPLLRVEVSSIRDRSPTLLRGRINVSKLDPSGQQERMRPDFPKDSTP